MAGTMDLQVHLSHQHTFSSRFFFSITWWETLNRIEDRLQWYIRKLLYLVWYWLHMLGRLWYLDRDLYGWLRDKSATGWDMVHQQGWLGGPRVVFFTVLLFDHSHHFNLIALSWLDLSWLVLSLLELSWLDLSWLDLSRIDLSWLDLPWLDLRWLDLPCSRKNFVSENCRVQENIGTKIFGLKEILCPKNIGSRKSWVNNLYQKN